MRSPLIPRSRVAHILASAALLVAATPGVALATPTFPTSINGDLGLSYVPPCTVCHETDSGGTGTVTRAFGEALKQNGLSSGNTAALKTALDALAAAGTDSDCDGVNDVQQLKDGRDPNTGAYIDGSGKPTPEVDGGCTTTQPEGPAFGCGAQVAAGSLPDSTLPLVATLATALALTLSRRRRA